MALLTGVTPIQPYDLSEEYRRTTFSFEALFVSCFGRLLIVLFSRSALFAILIMAGFDCIYHRSGFSKGEKADRWKRSFSLQKILHPRFKDCHEWAHLPKEKYNGTNICLGHQSWKNSWDRYLGVRTWKPISHLVFHSEAFGLGTF